MNARSSKRFRFSIVGAAFFVLLGAISFGAGAAAAQKVRLRAQITPECFSGSSRSKFADIYADGNIAVQGSFNCRGAFIYDISNPDAPVLAAHYNPGENIQFLETVVVGTRGYFGSGNTHGVHIVDLSNPYNPVLLGVVGPSSGNGFHSIHEMVVSGNYLIQNFNGFTNKLIKVINVSNPSNPVFVRDINPTEINWVHAMHIRGGKMYTSGWGNASNRARTEIYDISNIGTQAPTLLGFIEDTSNSVTAGNNMHSSWTSEDGNYLYSARETATGSGDLRVYNVSNPAQPLLVKRISMQDLNLNAVTPHNPVVMGNKLYVSWYQAGVQVFDIGADPSAPRHLGQYDTFQNAFAPTEAEKALLETAEPWDVVCGVSSAAAAGNPQNSFLPTTFEGNWAVFPFLGEDKILAGDMTNGLLILDATKAAAPLKNRVSDFDGDGKTDFSIYRPSDGFWAVENSSDGSLGWTQFGLATDKIQSGDFDGDGRTDHAVFRPSDGVWYVLGSANGFFAAQFGTSGDVPVAGDYDADGKTDFAVYRPSSGVWYVQQSELGFRVAQWGLSADQPVVGDFEGDGKTDFAVWRPSSGVWYILQSSSTLPLGAAFGKDGDRPLSGDFDGDGKTDLTVYRPSEGIWYFLFSRDNSFTGYRFGIATDTPIPADYDGDGRADIAVFRAGENAWYRLNSTNGAFAARAFGQNGDVPAPVAAQP